jgi:signal transduction histidine kinase
MFTFPGSLLAAGDNQLGVELGTITHQTGCLGPVWVGPEVALRPAFERQYFYRSTLPKLETLLAIAMALLMFALWRSSRDRSYGTFASVCLLWSISSMNHCVRDPPLADWTWERLIHITLFGFGVALALWTHSFLGIRRPRIDRALLYGAAVATVCMALVPAESFYSTMLGAHVLTLLLAFYSCALLVVRLRVVSIGECYIFVVCCCLALGFGGHDLAINTGWLPQSTVYMTPHIMPLVITTFGGSLIQRFARSLRRAEDLNREMERRVEEKRAEIEHSYEKLKELEHERLLSTERGRMIREMHDGLGSQLTTMLALIERGRSDPTRLSIALRGALDEMRLVMDSLDSEPRDAAEVLGVLRPRIQPMLQAAGIQLDWHIPASRVADEEPTFGPEESLHVLRVTQEAIANAVKHARASRIEVKVHIEHRQELWVSVADNGTGFSSGRRAHGRGLLHMRQRAAALGGLLEVTSSDKGTRVELRVPIPCTTSTCSVAAMNHSTSSNPCDSASNTASARERTSSLR